VIAPKPRFNSCGVSVSGVTAIPAGSRATFHYALREELPPNRSRTIRFIKDCGVSRERHSFDKNDGCRRGILLEGR
jgi:hypothetical protein